MAISNAACSGELARAIAQVRGVPFGPRYAPSRIGDVLVSIGDPRKARRDLGVSAETDLAHGLAQTVAAMLPEASGADRAESLSRAG